jgi:hypothetical protein
MSAVPDLAAPVVGFRSWRVANGRLQSPYVPCRWDGPEMHAECRDANRGLQRGRGWLAAPHDSPHPDCQCGIYAYHRPGPRTWFGEVWWCEGVITAWGRIEVHGQGIRAEFARVRALARPERGGRELGGVVEAIGARLGVPVVGEAELPGIALALGGTVPFELRPA